MEFSSECQRTSFALFSTVLLLGLTPIYLCITLGMLIVNADDMAMSVALTAGLALPFLADLWGGRALASSVETLSVSQGPPEQVYAIKKAE
ncbi:MAG: hypothetical protein ACRELG_29015 [Gemmataceae bacterium]